MSEERDDEVLELTEDMKAEPDAESAVDEPPAVEGDSEEEPTDDGEPGDEAEENGEPGDEAAESHESGEGEPEPEAPRPSRPQPRSPFMLLVSPRSEEEIRESRVSVTSPEARKDEARPSFVPRQSGTPVVASPVVKLGEGGPATTPKADGDGAEPEAADAGAPAEPVATPDEAAEESVAEPAPETEADAEEEDEILDLGQEFVVGHEVTDDDVGTEPIPLVATSKPPPPGTEPTPEAEATDAEEIAGEPADDATAAAEVSHPFDFGVPEMVFDTVSEPPPPAFEGEQEAPAEGDDGEELDDADLELQEEEAEVETEEIDLAEAEDLTPAREPRMPIADVGPTPEERRRRRRRRRHKAEWWSQIFDDDYVALLPKYTKRDTRRELDFVEKSLGVSQGELVLDLACGGGRHSVGMARRNFRVVGVDISLSMLARAGELAQEAGQKINFIHGDMRDLGFERTFDGIFCLGTSFGYFDEKTNASVLGGVFRALKPGRRFLLEMVNRDYIITKQPNLIWFEGDGVVCMEETDFSYITSRLHVKRQIIVGNGERQRSHEFSLRLYSLHEIGQLLHGAGFSVIQVGGHPATPGAFFGADSAQMVIVAERRR